MNEKYLFILPLLGAISGLRAQQTNITDRAKKFARLSGVSGGTVGISTVSY